MLHMIAHRSVMQNLKADIVEGLVLALVIALSFIVLVSFADFLRFHWIDDNPREGVGQRGRQRRRARLANRVFLGALPNNNVQPQIQIVPENNNDDNNDNNNNNNNVEINQVPPPHGQLQEVGNMQPAGEVERGNDTIIGNNDNNNNNNNNNTAVASPPTPDENAVIYRDNREETDTAFHDQREILDVELDTTSFNEIVGHPQDAMLENENNNDNNNNNNNNGDMDDADAVAAAAAAAEEEEEEEDDDAFNEAPGGEVEIRLALDDILGLRDPAHLLLRNVLWLIAFNGIYIGIFASIPCMIGQAVSLALSYLNTEWMTAYLLVPNLAIVETLAEVNRISSASSSALHLSDIYSICIGYSAISSVVFILHLLSSLLKLYVTRNSLLNVFAEVMRSLASILKVGILLFIRIFTLPICLGTTLLYSFNLFFQYNKDMWVEFVTSKLVGAISLSWIIGISYMLTVTLSVLQLREVLHPDILAQAIRPQEPHLDLLSSLINESYFTHVRRICASMLVYLILLAMFVHLPMYMSMKIFNSTMQPVTFNVWYVLPELQLPAELAIVHIVFLTILDKKKNCIGKLQYQWMLFASEKLGFNRFIIPYRMIYKKKERGTNKIVVCGARNAHLPSNNYTVLTDRNNVPIVGRPMRRPPPDWDARTTQSLGRWSWGTEEKSRLETSVAPRVVPTYWLFRCVLLILLSWLVVIACVLFAFFVPITIGRCVYDTLQLTSWGKHDPVLFLLGLVVCASIQALLSSSRNRKFVVMIALEAIGFYKGSFKMKLFWIMFQAFTILLAIVLSAGLMVQIFFVNRLSFELDSANILTVALASLKGALLTTTGIAFIASDPFEQFLRRHGLLNPFLGITDGIRRATVAYFDHQTPMHTNERAPEETEFGYLTILKGDVLWPIFLGVVWRGAARVALIAVLFRQFLLYAPVVSQYKFEPVETPEGLLVFLRVTVLLVFSEKFNSLFRASANILFDRLYKHIRDDNYLIGRKLKNMPGGRRAATHVE